MYNINSRGDMPIFEYLYVCIKNDILSGKFKRGSKLPSKRTMANLCGVSVITVENAYSQLIDEGYIKSVEKKGYFVEEITVIQSSDEKKVFTDQSVKAVDLSNSGRHGGNESFPLNTWSKLMREVISDKREKLFYRMPSEGIYELRCEISNYLYRNSGLAVSPDRIIIGAGTEYLCSLLIMLIGRTSIYAFEDPCYKKIPLIFSANDASVRYVPIDNEGILIDKLIQSGASVLHCSPSNNYPSGVITSIGRRYQLLEWLSKKENRYIIEDDFDSELRTEGKQIQSLASIDPTGRVIFVNTFTKTISPSFRVGYMILPDTLLAKFKDSMAFFSCTVPSFEQYTLAKFISGGYFERHMNRMRANNKIKKNRIIKALSRDEFGDYITVLLPKTGTTVCVEFQGEINQSHVSSELRKNGIDIDFLSDYTVENKEFSKGIAIINYESMSDDSVDNLADCFGMLFSSRQCGEIQ